MREFLVLLVAGLWAGHGLAQSSSSYSLTEHTLNAGGNPLQGSVLSSSGYRVTLDALGETVVRRSLASPSYQLDSGFVAAYGPPGEVQNLRFVTDDTTLAWNHEPSVGSYVLYRDPLTGPGSAWAGGCLQGGIDTNAASDTQRPPPGTAFAYLATARNRIGEEGPTGYDSSGAQRSPGSACP